MKRLARGLGNLASKSKKRLRADADDNAESMLVKIAIAVLVVIFGGLYLYKLGSFAPTGGGELHAIQAANNPNDLLQNPLLVPFKLMAYIFMQLPISDLLAVRLASVAMAFMSGSLFFMLARRWYGDLNAVIATLLFITSGWLLHTGRHGAAFGALMLTVLALLQFFAWMNHTKSSSKVLWVGAIVGFLALFTPGGLWLSLAGALVCRKQVLEHLKSASTSSIVGASLIAAASLALLSVAILRDPSIVRQWIGLPGDTPTIVMLAKQALTSISAFIIRGPFQPEVWLAHTPLLDVASSILLLTGVLFYARHMRNTRTLLMLSFLAVGVVLVMFNSTVALSYLTPIIYLVMAGGLAYFMHQWRKVFPKNPIARSIALTTVGIVILTAITFHTQRYFIAWHYSPDTIQAFEEAKQGTNPTPYLIQ